ncbi:MAG: DUF2267 domain-containing protein [Aquificae bacterium]|nr:DUF2267 domain-containing protein [Aquificota bacterium]
MKFEKYVHKGNQFLKELAEELGDPQDKDRAGRVLRAVLHALRKRLTPEEFLDLLAQLPMCVKAIAVDGWRIHESPDKSIKHVDDLVRAVIEEDRRTAAKDFGSEEQAKEAIKAVLRVIKRHVSDGEIKDIEAELPEQLKRFIEEA